MKHTVDFYEQIGASGLRAIAEDFSVTEDVEFLLEQIEKNDRLLDLGCGYGRVAISLACAGYKVTGIDQSESLIEAARKKADEEGITAIFDVGDITHLPYKDKSFDVVFSFWNTFNDLLSEADQRMTLAETHRVLVDGGKAFFTVLNGEDEALRTQLQENELGERVLLESTFFDSQILQYVHTRESIRSCAQKAAPFSGVVVDFIEIDGKRRILLELRK